MSLPVLGSFPNTIANLPDKPNMSGTPMKAALQADVKTLWEFNMALLAELATSIAAVSLPVSVANGGTGGTTKPTAREGIGIYAGKTAPDTIKSDLAAGDIYLYFPDLP